ncbi:MAG: Yip1 family protein [Candidatus Rhabdochlamydia sp.]
MQKQLPVNPWLGIWTHPKATIRAIIRHGSDYCLPLLYLIYGVPLLFQIFQNVAIGDQASLLTITVSAVLGGLVLGWAGINFTALLIYWTGKWVRGRGSFKGVRAAVGWSGSIGVITLLIWTVQMIAFKGTLFASNFLQSPFTSSEMMLLGTSSLIQLGAVIWGFFIIINTLSEVQQFSLWKAILNLLLMSCSLMGALIVLSVITPGLFY